MLLLDGRRWSHALAQTLRAKMRIETSSRRLLYCICVVSITLRIETLYDYSTIGVCHFSTWCTFYSIRLDPLTKTCFCGFVLKAVQSNKYNVSTSTLKWTRCFKVSRQWIALDINCCACALLMQLASIGHLKPVRHGNRPYEGVVASFELQSGLWRVITVFIY